MMMKFGAWSVGLLMSCVLAVASVQAANVPVTKANGDFIAGTGIPSDNFLVADNGVVSAALKVRGRDSGQPLSIAGNVYEVAGGAAASDPNASWWNFDFQFTPGESDTVGGENYILTVDFDTDSSAATDFVTISAPMFGFWDAGDGYFENPGGGAWSSDDIDYVYSQSWRPDFGFLAGEILGEGEYTIRFRIANSAGDPLMGTEIIVQVNGVVVPLPSAVGLGGAGLAMLGLVGRRRRQA